MVFKTVFPVHDAAGDFSGYHWLHQTTHWNTNTTSSDFYLFMVQQAPSILINLLVGILTQPNLIICGCASSDMFENINPHTFI